VNATQSADTSDAIAWAKWLAPVMYLLSLAFLVLLAVLIVSNLAQQVFPGANYDPGKWVRLMLLLIWPLFILEYLATVWLNRQQGWNTTLKLLSVVCILPPLRLAAPAVAMQGKFWLPKLGWQLPGRALSVKLSRRFSTPMLLIALLILPILLLEFGFRGVVEKHPWLTIIIHFSTGFIWCAFAYEFIVMVSATNRKVAYIKKNWIDLAIILLPLISFLRSIRVLRIARLARFQKLAKLSRVYRMRGLGMKAFRALMLLQFVNRLMRVTPEKQLLKLKKSHADKSEELAALEADIVALEKGKSSYAHYWITDSPWQEDQILRCLRSRCVTFRKRLTRKPTHASLIASQTSATLLLHNVLLARTQTSCFT